MNLRIERFHKEFEGVDMAKYFNLSSDIRIYHTLNNQQDIREPKIQLRIKYLRVDPCPRLLLPIELVSLIQSYLIDRIELLLEVTYPRNYPFLPPQWELVEVNHNLHGHIHTCWHGEMTLPYYYRDKVREHNESNRFWSPAISIPSDLLEFIRRVNHFEEMFTSIRV